MFKALTIPKINFDNEFFNLLTKVPELHKKIDFAGQDQIDLISYSGLHESSSFAQIGDSYIRTLFVSGYPYLASTGWINGLINFAASYDLSYHLEPIEAALALPKLNRKITELESVRRTLLKEGRVIGPEVTDPLNSATTLRDSIQRGEEKLFQVSIYITLRAKSLSDLNKVTETLESVLSSKLFYSRVAVFQQLEALQSILPRGEDLLAQKRNLDSSSTSLTFPFSSSDLAHEDGILYGINRTSSSLVMIDRFSLQNANSIIFAQSGSGKSYTAKVEVLRQLLRGTKVIVIDPEREYERLAEEVGGTYIKISTSSKQKINPFDLATKNKGELLEKTQHLTDLISLMSEGLSADEKSALDQAILKLYETNMTPLFKDLAKILKKSGQRSLVKRLSKFLKGSASSFFDAQTNIDLSNRLIVFDIKDLTDSLRPLMMMLLAGFVENEVKKKPIRRILVVDEAWKLLEHEETARFLSGLTRRSRKYYLGVTLISQQAADFLSNKYGQVIASQSSLRILLRQDTTTIEKVVEEFKLSSLEKNLLLTSGKGEALILADDKHVSVRVVASTKEHPVLTTDPRDSSWVAN